MHAIAVSNGYMSGSVYVIWTIPYDGITEYDVYRDGVIIASSSTHEFVSPTVFDHDHHTNLFRKDSKLKLMHIDENVERYRNYTYKIIARRTDEDGTVRDTITSNTATIEAQ